MYTPENSVAHAEKERRMWGMSRIPGTCTVSTELRDRNELLRQPGTSMMAKRMRVLERRMKT